MINKGRRDRIIKIKGVEFTERQIIGLQENGLLDRMLGMKLAQKQVKLKNDPASVSITNTPALQGPLQYNENLGGAFSSPGVRPTRFNAVQRPRSLARMLKPKVSEYNQEILEIMTEVTSGSGTNATGFCDNPPSVGNALTCKQTFLFSEWYKKLQLNSIPQLGQLRNRAEVPGQILNTGPQDNPLIPDLMYRIMDTRSQLQYELYLLGMDKARTLEYVLVQGDSSKSSVNAANGWIKEFDGIDKQIKTGHADPTGRLCAALDSMVTNFSNNLIGNTVGGGDPRTITQLLSDQYYAAQDRADRTGMGNIVVGFLMRKEMFRALTDVYANTYATSRFQTNTLTAGTPQTQDALHTNDLRLEMLKGNFLLIEGQPVPVVFSDGIAIGGVAANTYAADIYLVAWSWEGMPLVNLEFFDMANPYQLEYVGFVNADDQRVLNNGMYRVGYRSTGLCKEYHFADRMRLILETPFLCGRIDNVTFTYYAQTRDANPGSSFYVGGGVSYQS